MKRAEVRLNPRDIEILYFLWKWKVSTTKAITAKFFSDRNPCTGYKRLWELEQGRFIDSVSDWKARHHVWTLAKLGFQILKQSLPELKEEGFRSENITHDLVTSAVHLGGYHLNCPPEVELFSEQQLRRHYLEMYPDWVPRSELHRPDGYWRVPVGNPMATIALEVELSKKKSVKYEIIADFYATYPSVIRVLWLVAKPKMATLLHKKIAASLRNAPMIHNFVSFPNFMKSGWAALIEHGPEQGFPIARLLGKKAESLAQDVGGNILLDTRKSPYVSKVYRPLELGLFRY